MHACSYSVCTRILRACTRDIFLCARALSVCVFARTPRLRGRVPAMTRVRVRRGGESVARRGTMAERDEVEELMKQFPKFRAFSADIEGCLQVPVLHVDDTRRAVPARFLTHALMRYAAGV